jgi:transcriptional regulator with XRE-family HTH domain
MNAHSLKIGSLLRTLRRERNITGERLAQAANMSQSKVSKIETGFYAKLTESDVDILLDILDAPKIIRQQIYAHMNGYSKEPERAYRPLQVIDSYAKEKETTLTRSFRLSTPHPLLQTMEYRESSMGQYFAINPADERKIGDIMKELPLRQDQLWDTTKYFHFIMYESVLYTLVTDTRTQLAQLDRIERFVGGKRIKVGILPFKEGLKATENTGFRLYDDTSLITANGISEVEITDQNIIREYIKIFDLVDQRVVYGEAARRLIREATDYFS